MLVRRCQNRRWFIGLKWVAGLLTTLSLLLIPAIQLFRSSSEPSEQWEGSGVGTIALAIVDESIVLGGPVTSVDQSLVKAKVEQLRGLPSFPGVFGPAPPAPILEVIPQGTNVHEGDVLCRLDSSAYQEALRLQLLEVDRAQSDLARAQLSVEVNQIELLAYREGERTRIAKEKNVALTLAQTRLARAEDVSDWSREMLPLGYISSADLQRDELEQLRAEVETEKARIDLETFQEFEAPKQIRTLEIRLEQAEAELGYAEDRLQSAKERADKIREQIEFCTIVAPHNGCVLFMDQFYGDRYQIREGSEVYTGLTLFILTDLNELEVEIEVHERHRRFLELGQPARITFDAFPGYKSSGSLRKISLLPHPDWKHFGEWQTFLARISLDDTPDGLLPEMQAKVIVRTGSNDPVLTIPAEAVTWDQQGAYCVTRSNGRWVRTPVEVDRGRPDRLVLLRGPEEGTEVLLEPESIADNGSRIALRTSVMLR